MFFRKRLHRCFSGTGRALIKQQKKTANTAPVPLYARSYSSLY